MNQILTTKNTNLYSSESKQISSSKFEIFFKFQFITSVTIVLLLLSIVISYINFLNEKEKSSIDLINNYQFSKLYNNESIYNNKSNIYSDNVLFGILEIPKIKLYYPVFSNISEDLLKISPCKFYGSSPNLYGNICIAGHNYNNGKFFSNISLLSKGDIITLYDIYDNIYTYYIVSVYEVDENNLSPIKSLSLNSKELTLVTCNNLNRNRIIVKSKQK